MGQNVCLSPKNHKAIFGGNMKDKKYKLDEEEKDLLDSFEKGEWKKIKDMDEEIKHHVEYAKATHRKDKRVNIRISEKDLKLIKRKALGEGIPYQH